MFGLSDDKGQNPDLTNAQPGPAGPADAPIQPTGGNGPADIGSDLTSMPDPPSLTPTISPSQPEPTDNHDVSTVTPPEPTPPPTISLDHAQPDTAQSAAPEKEEVKEEAHTPPLMAAASDDKLLEMKQQALQSLAPLVDHLDQTPEEKFKTTMMLIQASDNADLVKDAYEAANQITDEKARAQALLDVVNEINYFTHNQHNSSA